MNLKEFRTKLYGMCGLATVEKAFELYSEVEKENERLKVDNERLKGEVRKWKRDSAITSAMFRLVVQGKECTSTKVLEDAERVENLEKENAKLKCLALHAMSELFGYKTLFSNKKRLRTKYGHFENKFYEAYRKAKAELRNSNG